MQRRVPSVLRSERCQLYCQCPDIWIMSMATTSSKKGLYAALIGTVLVALCCFSPILVILLAAVGLSALTPYLDYILLPALGVMIVVTIASYLRWRKSA